MRELEQERKEWMEVRGQNGCWDGEENGEQDR